MLKIVILWWAFIFILSCFYNGDFVSLSLTTQVLLVLFVIILSIGGWFASLFFKKNEKVNDIKLIDYNADKPNYFIIFLILYYSFLLFLLIKLILVNGSDVLVYVRVIVFSDDYALNPFFKSAFHLFIHRILIIPSILALYIIGLKNHFYFSKNKLFKISIVLLVIDSIVMFGRLNLYYMLLLYFFSAFLTSNYKSIIVFILNKIKFSNVFIIAIFLSILLLLTILRSVEDSGFLMSSIASFIDYNIIGFKIFDANLWNPKSIIHIHTYGRSLLGQIDSVFSILYRLLIDDTFLPANSENAKYLDTFIDIGEKESNPVNAFGTIFFTLYRDFGYFGILLFPFFLGFIINWFSLKFKSTNNPKYFILGLLFMYSTVFSVYQSVFEGVFWPMYLILVLSININFPKIKLSKSI